MLKEVYFVLSGMVAVSFAGILERGATCKSDSECRGANQACFDLNGLGKCATYREYMTEYFAIGRECTSDGDCPEACYTGRTKPTCGPYLRNAKKTEKRSQNNLGITMFEGTPSDDERDEYEDGDAIISRPAKEKRNAKSLDITHFEGTPSDDDRDEYEDGDAIISKPATEKPKVVCPRLCYVCDGALVIEDGASPVGICPRLCYACLDDDALVMEK